MNAKYDKVIEDYCCMMDYVDRIGYIKQLIGNFENSSIEWLRPLSDIGVPCVSLRAKNKSVIEYMSRTVFLMKLRVDLYNLNKMKWKGINLNSSCGLDNFFIESDMIRISCKIRRIKDEIKKEEMWLDDIMKK